MPVWRWGVFRCKSRGQPAKCSPSKLIDAFAHHGGDVEPQRFEVAPDAGPRWLYI